MKSRIVVAPQIVLSLGLNEEQSEKLNTIADKLGVKHKPVPQESCNQKIGYLCGFRGFEKSDTEPENPTEEQCLVFSGIQQKNMSLLLKELKSSGIYVPLKAMVTPSNQSWTLSDLVKELKKEHEYMTGRRTQK